MSKDTLDSLFKGLQDEFDIEIPESGHQQRFLNKLNNQSSKSNNGRAYWKPLLAVAASVIVIITLVFNSPSESATNDLASVSPELSEAQDFFALTIAEELNKLNKESTPETEKLISDALQQLQVLETNYETLKIDLEDSGNDKRVIHAMISNFQTRIDILQNTLEQIETIKQLKNNNNENSSTI